MNRLAISLLGVLFLCSLQWHIPILVFVSIGLLWFILTALGSFLIQWDYFLPSIHGKENHQRDEVALTFDDGPHPERTPLVLDLLERFNARATFFCVGERMKLHPEIVRRIVQDGHTLGNHTYSHSRAFGFFPASRVKQELDQTNELAKRLVGYEMKLYRPAFGVTNPAISSAVKTLSMKSIGWNVRSLDTLSQAPDRVLGRIGSQIAPGAVILLHDDRENCTAILEQLLLLLREQGLRSVTIDELHEIQPYA